MIMKKMISEELLKKVVGGDGWTLLQYYCRGEAVKYNGMECEVIKAKLSFKYGWLYDIRTYWWEEDVRTIFYNVPQDDLVGDSD